VMDTSKLHYISILFLIFLLPGCESASGDTKLDFGGEVEGVELDSEYISINRGETLQLVATVSPITIANKDVTWVSTNSMI
jgi:uncharacterized protein YjdB